MIVSVIAFDNFIQTFISKGPKAINWSVILDLVEYVCEVVVIGFDIVRVELCIYSQLVALVACDTVHNSAKP